MNGLRCPKCDLINLLTAEACHRCGASLVDLPSTAQVSVPVEQTFQAQAFRSAMVGGFDYDNETGRKTFLWYRVYVGVILAFSLLIAAGGLIFAVSSQYMTGEEAQDALVMGIIYGVLGLFSTVIYGIALILPRKPYNWIVGLVMIALGLTSCCSLPAAIPLLIFWLKPETKTFFGRN